MNILRNKLILELTITIILLSPISIFAKNNLNTQKRLEKLSIKLERKRIQHHIPGMAIAIVKDDKVIFSKGFGVSNLKTKSIISANTTFGIGSTSKAFTSNIIGMLVDQGKMKWDSPVTKYLPYLKFSTKNADEQITIRDMLSHQTGFKRFSMLLSNEKTDRNEILQDSIKAKPWTESREKFQYTNLMYIGAGVASAKSVNTKWEILLNKLILEPLKMDDTTTSYSKLKDSPILSSGYMWDEENKNHNILPLRDHTNIAPAGGIYSNITDMAQWLRFQLGGGKFNDKQLISSKQLNETRTAQIKIGSNKAAAYGLGWFLTKYQNQKVMFHEGSVQGYSAIVAMQPESELGFVLLTNLSTTPFLYESMGIVWDQFLQTKTNKNHQNQVERIDFEKYTGDYVGNFGPFKNANFKLSIKENKLSLNVPGQTDYELKMPNKKGKWNFAITDTISVSFEKNQNGNISLMRLHQEGMDFELPRKGYPIIAEIALRELQPYLGLYKINDKVVIKVVIQNHRLALDVPGEMVYELHLPDSNNQRKFRINSSLSVKFSTDKNGNITLNQYQSGKKVYSGKRSNAELEKKSTLPSVTEIYKLRKVTERRKAFNKHSGFQLKGKITMHQSGIEGIIHAGFDSQHKSFERIDLGKHGIFETILNNDQAITKSNISKDVVHNGVHLSQLQKLHPAASYYWDKWYNDIKVVRAGEIKGRKVYMLKLKGDSTQPFEILLDAVTGDILRQKTNLHVAGIGPLPTIMTFSDYRELNGLRIPFNLTVKNKVSGLINIIYNSFDANVNFKQERFKIETKN